MNPFAILHQFRLMRADLNANYGLGALPRNPQQGKSKGSSKRGGTIDHGRSNTHG
jgi:hypothetical protein